MLSRGGGVALAGDIDTTFAAGGTVDLPGTRGPMQVQSDGKIVVGGSADGSLIAYRYTSNGSLDLTFGADGTGRSALATPPDAPGGTGEIALAPDGSIVVAGSNQRPGISRLLGDLVVARFTPAGLLDPAFAGGGVAVTDVDGLAEVVTDLFVQPDGKVVVAGYDLLELGRNSRRGYLVRYSADGTLDAGFGDGGRVVIDRPSITQVEVSSVAGQPDGRILVVVNLYNPYDFGQRELVRYTASGAPDDTFGTVVKPPLDDWGAVKIAPGGRIVLPGSTRVSPEADTDFALFAFTPDGTPDLSFGRRGRTATNFLTRPRPHPVPDGTRDAISSISFTADGKIVAVGSTSDPSNADHGASVALARYGPDGTIDRTFGRKGVASARLKGRLESLALDSAIAPDGGIIVIAQAASLQRGTGVEYVLARFHNQPAALPGRNAAKLSPRGGLTIRGTWAADTVIIGRSGSSGEFVDVSVNGSSQQFPFSGVRRITVNGGGGDDEITIAPEVTIPATLLGGAGNDRLSGGGGIDRLVGGGGNDRFFSRDSAVDLILGGRGQDEAEKDDLDRVRGVESILP